MAKGIRLRIRSTGPLSANLFEGDSVQLYLIYKYGGGKDWEPIADITHMEGETEGPGLVVEYMAADLEDEVADLEEDFHG